MTGFTSEVSALLKLPGARYLLHSAILPLLTAFDSALRVLSPEEHSGELRPLQQNLAKILGDCALRAKAKDRAIERKNMGYGRSIGNTRNRRFPSRRYVAKSSWSTVRITLSDSRLAR